MRMGERMEGEIVTCEKNKCSDGSEEVKLLENHDRNQLAHRRIDVDRKGSFTSKNIKNILFVPDSFFWERGGGK